MRSAVYYPHTEIKDENILKTSLLLWDSVEFIVPYKGYMPCYENKEFSEAIEVFGKNHVPTAAQKREAHGLIEDFATSDLPESFFYQDCQGQDVFRYGMWPQKLLPETWEILKEAHLAGGLLPNSDYPLRDGASLTLMSLLADCCAGKTKARITDRGAAYAALTNLLVGKSTGSISEEAIVPVTLKIVDSSSIPLKKLISLRKREIKQGGTSLYDLRRRYAEKIANHGKELKAVNSLSDVQELSRQFEQDMRLDLHDLRSELHMNKTDMIFTKDVIATIVAGGAAFISALQAMPTNLFGALTLAGGAVSVGGLYTAQSKYAANKVAIMKRHPMAYMLETARS